MQEDYWEAMKHFDGKRLEPAFTELLCKWPGVFFPKPAELVSWMDTYMYNHPVKQKYLPEPEITNDMRLFQKLTAHFYASVVALSNNASSNDSVTEWMKTKFAKCKTEGCVICATKHNPDWVDEQYKLINEGVRK